MPLISQCNVFYLFFFLFSLVPCGLRPCWWLQPPQHPQSRTCPGLFHGHDEVTLLLHLLSQHDPEAAVARLGWLELRRQRSRDEEQVSKFVNFICTVISPQICKLNIEFEFEYLNHFFVVFKGKWAFLVREIQFRRVFIPCRIGQKKKRDPRKDGDRSMDFRKKYEIIDGL